MKQLKRPVSLFAALVAGGGVALGAEVVVIPGFDYTNVVIRVDGAPSAEVSVVDSANVEVAPAEPLAPASAYAYDVQQDGVPQPAEPFRVIIR